MFPNLDYIKQLVEGLKFAANRRFVDLEKFAEDAKAKLTTLLANRPNWEQNDPTALDYIDGKPFHDRFTVAATVGENCVISAETGWGGTFNMSLYSVNMYRVIFDGVVFDGLTAVDGNPYTRILGNASLCNGVDPGDGGVIADMPDTGEPFAFLYHSYNNTFCWFYTRVAGEHTVSVYELNSDPVKIKERFLPAHKHDPSTDLAGAVPINRGGTGATTQAKAMAALGRGHGTCSTAAGTTEKTASISGFVLGKGALIGIKFSNVNTASAPTLNISSTGAKSIYNYKTNAAVVEGDMGACLHLFMYNEWQWVLLNPLT